MKQTDAAKKCRPQSSSTQGLLNPFNLQGLCVHPHIVHLERLIERWECSPKGSMVMSSSDMEGQPGHKNPTFSYFQIMDIFFTTLDFSQRLRSDNGCLFLMNLSNVEESDVVA